MGQKRFCIWKNKIVIKKGCWLIGSSHVWYIMRYTKRCQYIIRKWWCILYSSSFKVGGGGLSFSPIISPSTFSIFHRFSPSYFIITSPFQLKFMSSIILSSIIFILHHIIVHREGFFHIIFITIIFIIISSLCPSLKGRLSIHKQVVYPSINRHVSIQKVVVYP